MAKRNTRKTDPEIAETPERRQTSPSEPDGRAAAPKATRSRRKSNTAATAASAPVAKASPITAEGFIEAPTTVTPSFTTVAEVAAVELSHDQIAERAYHLYLARGRQPGDPFADWLTAERELRRRFVGA